jgi:mono/diheme cytochrome c family protein
MTSRFTWGLVALVALAAFLLAVPFALGSKSTAMPGNVTQGKLVFIQFCGKCHMMHAAGSQGTIGPNLDQDTQGVDYSRVITSVREGIGGIQAEYTFGKNCSPTSSRCLTWDQLHSVAKFVVTKRPGGIGRSYT